MTLDGGIAWTPTVDGAYEIAMLATNPEGEAEQRYSVNVYSYPVITSTANVTFLLGTDYAYDDNRRPEALGTGPLNWSLDESPEDMWIDPSTGEIFWEPHDVSPVSVGVRASNAFGSDEQYFTIARESTVAPYIAATANLTASVNSPYRYDADGYVEISGSLAGEQLELHVVQAPAGFIVHPNTLEVGWAPLSPGLVNIGLALRTPRGHEIHRYDFSVGVGDTQTLSIEAVADVTPTVGSAPLMAVYDATDSRGSDGLPILQYAWDTGAGPVLRSTEPQSSFVYTDPGGYSPTLEIWDSLGFFATTRTTVAVLDGDRTPPRGVIEADTLQGEGQLAVQFGCDCSAPGGDLVATVWQFGDGESSTEFNPRHHFSRPGNYQVRLSVEDSQGLTARDRVAVTVTQSDFVPPIARIATESGGGDAPTVLQLRADVLDPDGVITGVRWLLFDGSIESGLTLETTVAEAGYYTIRLEATDNDGLTGFDEQTIIISHLSQRPLRIVSAPHDVATTGVAYMYDRDGKPSYQGTPPVVWSLGRQVDEQLAHVPDGMRVDAHSGEISWTPAVDQAGTHRVTLRATGAVNMDFQDFEITVGESEGDKTQSTDGTAAVSSGCACALAGANNAWWLACLLPMTRNRRRLTRRGA